MAQPEPKRRKWDVAAPGAGPRAGIGSGAAGTTGINHPAYGGPPLDSTASLYGAPSVQAAAAAAALPGLVTFAPAPGVAPAAAAAPPPVVDNRPLDNATITKIQQSALDVVARLNQVGAGALLRGPAAKRQSARV